MTLTCQGHNCLKLGTFLTCCLNSNISDNIQATAFKLGMMLDFFMAYAHAYFDDLDFDARSQ